MAAIKLQEELYLHNSYGKYEPNLSILTDSEEPPVWEGVKYSDFNIDGYNSDTHLLKGDYFVSKKGTLCFRVKSDGNHILIKDGWHGRFSSSSFDREEIISQSLYCRNASSNGGGTGYFYIILPRDWKFQLSLEDI